MRIAVCLTPERELAAELVVFTQMHAAALGGEALSLQGNRPRLVLGSGEIDDWTLTPDLLADLAPEAPLEARFGSLQQADGVVYGPIGMMAKEQNRTLLGLQARAAVRLAIRLPHHWTPGIELGRVAGERLRPALRADWANTMEGRRVSLNRLAFLRLDDAGHAVASVASHALGA